jgi:hypothetical protein
METISMRYSLESFIALLVVLIVFAMLPSQKERQVPEVKPLISIVPAQVTQVAIQLEKWKGHWQSPKGSWLEDDSKASGEVFAVLHALSQLRNLSKLNKAPEEMGAIGWQDDKRHQIILSRPKFGDNLAIKIEGQWYLGDGELLFKLKELMKVSP